MSVQRRGAGRRGLRAGFRILIALALATASSATTANAADFPDSFTIHGSGSGHGVGMPQWGAYEMSRQGNGGISILKHFYSGARAPYVRTPLNIQVQVYGPDPAGLSRYGDSSASTSVRTDGGSWRIRSGGTTLAHGSGPTTFEVDRTRWTGKPRIVVEGKRYIRTLLRIQWSGTTYFRPHGTAAVARVDGAHGAYRHGRLTVTTRQGIPNITNDLRLNTEYLYGIAEMPSTWALHGGGRALRAQAMAARAYAIAHHDVRDECRCHVVDDERDQYFTGWRKQNEGPGGSYGALWTKHVDANVRGPREARALVFGGDPVAAHYYSSGGARTANSEDVWQSVVPYERSVNDPYSMSAPGNPYASWTRTVTQQAARDLFGLHNVASIEVTRTWSSGQVRTLKGTQPNGRTATITGKADQMRRWIGQATTRGWMPATWVSSVDPS